MVQMDSFSLRALGGRERLEDYVADSVIQTAGGLNLHIIVACDGAGGGEAGELAARLTARTTLDSLEVSDNQNIPRLMVDAVEEANRVVYNELSGTGTSTIAMVVVDLDDGEHGRAYIASVGNSRIYLMRERELVRLNIDHTLANEYVYAGQMSRDEAERLENADYPTRIIGVNPEVQVDIGFYVERGNPFVNAKRAFNIGKSGMLLKEGDTLLVATEGLFHVDAETDTPMLTSAELLRHAMDDNAERAARNFVRYASNRQPTDNTSVSLLFVPSRFRRPVTVSRLSPRQRVILGTVATVFFVLLVGAGLFLFDTYAQQQNINNQFTAIADTRVALNFTPTFTPTATATATTTPTFTPSPAATEIGDNQVGFQAFQDNVQSPVLIGDPVDSPAISYITIGGSRASSIEAETGRVINRATFYMEEGSRIQYDNVNNTAGQESIGGRTFIETDLFARSRDFKNEGITLNSSPFPEATFLVETECFAYKQIPRNPDIEDDVNRLALMCFGGTDAGTCSYELGSDAPVEIPMNRRVLLDIDNYELVEITGPVFSEVRRYYNIVQTLAPGSDDVTCMGETLDPDGDNITFPEDACPQQFGFVATSGCPDEDGDGVRDEADECPTVAGLPELNGCAPTPQPTVDLDDDGFNDLEEPLGCVLPADAVDDEGCPVIGLSSYGEDE